jgi:aminoglycoside phosphotransferase (APT) family kinase protein
LIPIDDSEIKTRLLDYLARVCDRTDIAYAAGPDRITGGRDAAIFGFELSVAPAKFSGPLILRLARKPDPMRVRLEAIVYTTLAVMNYPVPRVAVTEPDAAVLGGPFMVMTRLAGRPLADQVDAVGKTQSLMGEMRRLLSLPAIVGGITDTWIDVQIRLHGLPTQPLLQALTDAGMDTSLVTFDGQLRRLGTAIEQYRLDGLKPALSWLVASRPQGSSAMAICHGDFHPLNILADHGRVSGIIDWENVVIAPPEMEVGSALVNIATVPFAVPPLLRPVVRGLVWLLLRKYLRGYRRRRPLDDAALRYFQVYRAMAQLTAVGRSLAEGQTGGAFQSETGVRNLIAHISGLTGLEPRLDFERGN